MPGGSGNVGIGTITPATSAILDVSSTTKGIVLPRMANPSDSVTTPVAGMMAYNTTTNKVQVYNGTTWNTLAYE